MKLSKQISFCGVLSALSVVTMLLSVFPFSTYAAPAFAGMFVIAATLECSTGCGVLCYVVTALLSLIICPDPEAKILYISFLGYYPIVHLRLQTSRGPKITWIIKFAVFNAVVVSLFYMSLNVLGVEKSSYMIGEYYIPWLLLLLGNIVFFVYDMALTRVCVLYRVRIHPLVGRFIHF